MYGTPMFNNYVNPYNMQMPNNANYGSYPVSNGIPKVTGLEGAKAYNLGANDSVALFDANDNVFYLKTTDSAGFASYRTFRFEEVAENTVVNNDCVSRAEFDELKQIVNKLVGENDG